MRVLLELLESRFVLTCVPTATLKNDDADDSEDEEREDDVEAKAERRITQAESAKRLSEEKQPTGRIVGMIKRNWRSFVNTLFSDRCMLTVLVVVDMSAILTGRLCNLPTLLPSLSRQCSPHPFHAFSLVSVSAHVKHPRSSVRRSS